jgi:hypothetical protein
LIQDRAVPAKVWRPVKAATGCWRKGKPHLKPRNNIRCRPAGRQKRKTVKGRYVRIPPQYQDIATSGLTYTVQKGPQTHDIELSAKSATAPGGAPGQ